MRVPKQAGGLSCGPPILMDRVGKLRPAKTTDPASDVSSLKMIKKRSWH